MVQSRQTSIGLALFFLTLFCLQAEATSVFAPFYISTPKLENAISPASDFKMVTVTFGNSTPNDSPFVLFLEARDKKGVTIFLQYHTGVMNAGSHADFASSWHSNKELVRYDIRAFAISNFTRPAVLTEVTTTDLALEPIAIN
jgi:hypothetical protein